MKEEIVTHIHHARRVFVIEKNIGKHRENCLCWQCANFCPTIRDANCRIANVLFEIDRAFGITTPVWECPEFVAMKKTEDK